jgi:hypothetical protein
MQLLFLWITKSCQREPAPPQANLTKVSLSPEGREHGEEGPVFELAVHRDRPSAVSADRWLSWVRSDSMTGLSHRRLEYAASDLPQSAPTCERVTRQ